MNFFYLELHAPYGCGLEYLTNQHLFISISGATSPLLPVYLCVYTPGQYTEPNTYVNDIPTAISGSTAYLFADDTKNR